MKPLLTLFRNSILFIIICIVTIFISSCIGDNQENRVVNREINETKITEISRDIPGNRDYLKVVESGIDGVFNPLMALSNGDKAISYLQFLPLLNVNRDFTVGVDNSLTRSYYKNDNSIKFELKNIKWWDGVSVSSSDILYSLQIILSPKYEGSAMHSLLFNIKGAKEYYLGKSDIIDGFRLIDEKSFELELNNPSIGIENALTFRPIPKHYYGKLDNDKIENLNNKPLGNGAYFLYDFEKYNYALLKSNETFYYGKPNIDNVLIKNESSGDVRGELFNGELDIADIGHSYKVKDDIIIKDNYLIYTQNKNYSKIIVQPFNAYKDDLELKKYLLSILKEDDFKNLSIELKYNESIISNTNRIFNNLKYPDFNMNERFHLISHNLFYDARAVNIAIYYFIDEDQEEIAKTVSDIFEKHGISTSIKEISKYEYFNLLSEGQTTTNHVIICDYKPGIYPDILNLLLHAFPEFDKEIDLYIDDIYGATNLEDRRNAYQKYILDIFDKGYARGIGTPIKRTAVRKSLRNIYVSEFLDWYEMDVWNIRWENDI